MKMYFFFYILEIYFILFHLDYILEHGRTQVTLLALSKTFRLAVLGQNIPKKLWMDLDEICWTGWVCDTD